MRILVFAALLVAAKIVNPSSAFAAAYCGAIDGPVTIAEGRYTVVSGTDEKYVNVYLDGGEELGLPSLAIVGTASNGESVTLQAAINIRDETTGDCGEICYELGVGLSDTTFGCNPNEGFVPATYSTVCRDTCDPADSGVDSDTHTYYYSGFVRFTWLHAVTKKIQKIGLYLTKDSYPLYKTSPPTSPFQDIGCSKIPVAGIDADCTEVP